MKSAFTADLNPARQDSAVLNRMSDFDIKKARAFRAFFMLNWPQANIQ
ncbi:MAG: hypothetical protein RR701_14225 [Comamonas sp.]